MEQWRIGEMTITWLEGGVTHLDGGAMFGVVPKPLWTKKYPVNDLNQIELRTDPILIQKDGKNLLIEAGIGRGKLTEKQKRNYGVTEESRIEKSLSRLGLTPEMIDVVAMTHLHFDHATGLTTPAEDGYRSMFPNAVIYATEVEWEEMRHPNIRSRNTYWKMNWEAITHQVRTFSQSAELLPGVRMIHTGGHSAGHAIISIEHEGQLFLHMADLMPTTAHKNVLWVLAFDDYPMDSIAAKQKWMEIGQKRQAWYLFYHDAYTRAVKWDENGKVLGIIPRVRS